MHITIAINGRFHAFDLAEQLEKKGYLRKLLITYPKFKVLEWGIPRGKINSLLPAEFLNRSRRFLSNEYSDYISVFQKEWFDRWGAKRIPRDTDLFVGWSGNSLKSIRKAKSNGAKTIVERCSSHMLYQQQILKNEYEKYGKKKELTPQEIIEKELQEYEEADFIAIPSLFVKRTFLEHGVPEEKLIHVPYGVNLEHFHSVTKEDGIFRVIHCGTLSLRKGVHYLLQAFFELKLANAELWLIGSMTDEIKPFMKEYANDRIFHKGPYPQNELYKYYSQGSVFCLASIEEGLAYVQAQAMACGLPVICTTNTGGEDIVRDGVDGFIVPIRDVEALKEKILYFYENRDVCQEMGESAKQRVRRGFSWDDYGEKMVAEYLRILK